MRAFAMAPALTLAGWLDSREVDNLGRQNAEAYQAALDEGRINGETYDGRILATSETTIRERVEMAQAAREGESTFREIRLPSGSSAPGASAGEARWLRLAVAPLAGDKRNGQVLWRLTDISADRAKQEQQTTF